MQKRQVEINRLSFSIVCQGDVSFGTYGKCAKRNVPLTHALSGFFVW